LSVLVWAEGWDARAALLRGFGLAEGVVGEPWAWRPLMGLAWDALVFGFWMRSAGWSAGAL
jgi:hypothetical protein